MPRIPAVKQERVAAIRSQGRGEGSQSQTPGPGGGVPRGARGSTRASQRDDSGQGTAGRMSGRGKRGRDHDPEDGINGEDASTGQRRRNQRLNRAHAASTQDDAGEVVEEGESEGDTCDTPRGSPHELPNGMANGADEIAPAAFQGPERGPDGFCKGNILSIYLENFMTYNRICLKPSPRLNLIIGPNGSGKSSIVCAIGLGLGIEPHLLARGAAVGSYVQRGYDTGLVRIELRGEVLGKPYIVERQIDRENHSDWLLNERRCTKKEIKELMARLNIQVDNLTQFLPQDRVSEFAALSKKELLEETTKAVGGPDLVKQHVDLVNVREQVKDLEHKTKLERERLQKLMEENKEIEGDVERVEKKDKLLAEAKEMKSKEPWILFRQQEAYCDELKGNVVGLNAEIDGLMPQKLAAEQAFRDVSRDLERKKAELDATRRSIKQHQQNRTAAQEKDEAITGEIGDAEHKIRDLQQQAKNAEAKKTQYRAEVARREAELEGLPPLTHPRDQLAPMTQRLGTARELLLNKEQEHNQTDRALFQAKDAANGIAHRLQQAKSTRWGRIKLCNDRNLEDATVWLDGVRGTLKGTVYGPLITEVEISDRAHAAALEQHVGRYLWKAFVTTNEQDRDFLVHQMKRFHVTIINAGNVDGETFRTRGMPVTDQMRALGVTSRLDEAFSAPPVVKHTLIKQAGLNTAFLASAHVDSHPEASEQIHKLGVSDLSTPTSVYFWRGSRYHSSESISITNIRHPSLLGQDGGWKAEESLARQDQAAKEQVQQLQARVAQLKSECCALEREEREAQQEVEAIKGAYKKEEFRRKELKQVLERRRQDLVRLESQTQGQLREQEDRHKERITRLLDARFQAAHSAHVALFEWCKLAMGQGKVGLLAEELAPLCRDRKAALDRLQKNLVDLQRDLADAERQVAEQKRQMETQRRVAREAADYDGDERIHDLFDSLPEDLEELMDAVREKEQEAECIGLANPNALEEYRRRKRDIDTREESLRESTEELRERTGRMQELRDSWLPRLRGLVRRISHTFSANFREMAVAGEVVLDEHGDEFKEYGIRVRVQFRDTAPMQDLSSTHQSGGERSVSTILYLVALQELSYCPFRVVDEINQGMDALNERKMFQQLVRATCRDNTPQCFLITPKLLPDLDYGERCTIHTVMNGPFIADFADTAGFKDGASLADALRSMCNGAAA